MGVLGFGARNTLGIGLSGGELVGGGGYVTAALGSCQ